MDELTATEIIETTLVAIGLLTWGYFTIVEGFKKKIFKEKTSLRLLCNMGALIFGAGLAYLFFYNVISYTHVMSFIGGVLLTGLAIFFTSSTMD